MALAHTVIRWLLLLGLVAQLAGVRAVYAADSFTSLIVTASPPVARIGDSVQLTVIGVMADGSQVDVTRAAAGTTYLAGDSFVQISTDGLVAINGARFFTTLAPYSVWIVVANGSATTPFRIAVAPTDADRDGMDDQWEQGRGLNPSDPSDAGLDGDGDGLANLQEFQRGTDATNPDTDGDTVSDGVEVRRRSDPLNPKIQFVLNETCTATIRNRAIQISKGGSFSIPNVPAEPGFYRVRVTCVQDGETIRGQSAFLTLNPNGKTDIGEIVFGDVDPIPVSLQITSPRTSLTTIGETTQLVVTGKMPDSSNRDLTLQARGTSYTTSNPAIATVGADGLVRAVSRGPAIIAARNEGVLASFLINVAIPNDADADGMPDEHERLNGLDPNDPTDAGQDLDTDSLTNLQEFQLGTNPRASDTDGDGLPEAEEIRRGTNVVRADSDGDGLADGQEVRISSNPLKTDTDDDGIADGIEFQLRLNPLAADGTTTVQGRVVDSAGVPVEGASAIVLGVFTGATDGTGFFSLGRVPATLGPFTVTARAVRNSQALEGASNPIGPVAGGTTDAGTIQIGLNSGTVAGLVVDPQNRPVAGAEVIVAGGVDLRTVVTDASGRYRVGNMVAGNLTVTARDPRTGLRGRATSLLLLNQSATVDLRLAPSGTVAGTVFGRDGITPVRSGVTVVLSGPTFVTTTTDVLGRYSVDFVPLGGVTVEASDGSGNRGRATGSLSVTADTVVLDVVFLGRGAVVGTVQDAGRNPVPNASVTLTSESVFGGSRTVTTDGSGRYAFGDVFVGPFSVAAKAPIARLAGKTSGRVDRDGETAAADITLVAAGTFTGIVSRTTGSPVAGVQVTLTPGGLSATTDSLGRYRLDLVPIGSYTLDAADSSTGDRGRRSGTLATQDEVRTVDIPLNGQGRVVVTVRDGASATVGGAQVNLDSHTVFGGRLSGMTQSDGTITFDRVLAGNFGLSATDTVTKLTGSRTASVAVGETANVTVQLQSAGSMLGSVFASDGSTPVSSIPVRLMGPVVRHATSGISGGYRFDIVPAGTYTVEALDAAGNVRARAGNLVLGTHGQELLANLTLIGVGTVTGLVRNPDDSVAAGVGVSLQSLAPGFGRSFFALTDILGRYTIPQVPVGGFSSRVSARVGPRQLFGEAQGQVSADGETVTADIQLSATLVPVSTTLFDANNFSYNLRENGSLQDGTGGVFGGDFAANRGALLLDIVTGGAPIRFTGQAFGTATQAGREISIHQSNLAGLEVTRRIFVPRSGYFARYLEVLNNPTASPISVDVKLSSHFRFMRKVQFGFTFDREPQIIATSSGDGVLDVSDPSTRDRWVEIDDDDDGDPFLVNTLAASAHVFDGAGGAQQAGQAQFTVDFTGRFGQLAQAWQNVTIPAGGTIAFLHFITEQTSRAGAQASAERLSQLPPEALTGLTATDISQIQNFAVPTDGVSALAPLPSLNGAVSGHVLAGDSETTIAGAQVRYQSRHPLFGRTQFAGSDGGGVFSIRPRFDDSGASVAIPVDDFMLNATHPQTAVRSPETPGTFMAGLEVADQNVVFSNSGLVSGIVRRFGGVVVSSGTVHASGGDLINAATSSIAADGSYRFTSLPAGSYTLGATLPHPQGSALTGASSVQIVNGEARIVDITIPPTGGVTGLVRRESGDVVVNVTVQLRAANFSRSTRTDTGGRFTFSDVPSGPVTLETVDSATNTAASAVVTVVAGQDAPQNLTLVIGATVAGLVTDTNNQAIAGAQVTLTALNGTFTATTGVDGRYRIERVAPGQVVVVATDAAGFRGRTSGNVGLSGQTITLNVRLIASGTVTGLVFRADRVTRVAGARVTLYSGGFSTTTNSDAQGSYSFDFVPVGSFTVDVTDTATGDRGAVSNQVTVNGETRNIDVVLTGIGAAVVTVRDAADNLISNAQVTLYSQTQFGGSQSGATGADGTVRFERVLAGVIFVSATDPTTLLGGSTTGTVAPGGTATVTVHLQPAGTVLGQVFAPDGAPVTGVAVRLLRTFFGSFRDTTSAGDGSFRFDAVPLGTYTLEALDTGNRLRAREPAITLATNGEVVTRNLTFAGLGTVSGQVLDPGGTPAPNLAVSLRSANAAIGGFFNATSDALGRYEITGVPTGRFTATASDPPRGLLGEASGSIAQDGQRVTADIRLLANAITLPVTLHDGNDFFFDIQENGSTRDGFVAVFAGDFASSRGAFLLDVVSGGTANRFTGTQVGHTEENRREVVIRQQNLAGLDVTRKIYVPRDGYFARYLEILSNPTTDPITVDVRVLSNFRNFFGAPQVVASSSGDDLVDVTDAINPDRWVIVDDFTDQDPFLSGGLPAVAFTFDGPGAAERAGAATFTSSNGPGQFVFEWKNVTIPAGTSVAYLHFGMQQTSRAAAQASAERLTQLAPEALAGFSADEVGQIRNFAVPADGISTLGPLPAVNGSVNGLLLAGDNATTIPFGQVRFKSRNVLFGRTHFGNSGANGLFTFASRFDDFGGSVAIPIDGFTLQAFHPQTGVQAPITNGSFAPGQTTATQNVVFGNTGVVRGVVRRHTGTAIAGGQVQVFGTNPFFNASFNVGADGSYLMTGVPPGTFTLTGFMFHPQGSSLRGTATATVVAGQTISVDITIEGTGTVTGTIQNADGTPAGSNVFVRLRNDSFNVSRVTRTNSTGQYTFSDFPVGTFTLEAQEPRTFVYSSVQVSVAQDQTTVQNLALVGLGRVEVQVNFASGTPAPNIQISIRQGQSTTFPGLRTDSAGRLVIPFAAVGDFIIRAYVPSDSSIFREVAGRVNNRGDVVAVNLTLPALAAVRVTVLQAEETPFAGAYVYIRHSFSTLRFVGTADANGFREIPVVPEGDFVIQARAPATSAFAGSATGTVTAADDGRAIDVTIRAPLSGNVQGTVFAADQQTRVRFAFMELLEPSGQRVAWTYTDEFGFYQFNGVVSGYRVVAHSPSDFSRSVERVLTFTTTGETLTIDVALPVGVVHGTVSFSDGVRAPSPNVFITQTDADGNTRTSYANSRDAAGNYTVIGPLAGDFSLVAQDSDGLLTTTVGGTIADISVPLAIDVTLPASGHVAGTVRDAAGSLVTFADVALVSTNAPIFYSRWTSTDTNGRYMFDHVPLGTFYVQACSFELSFVCGSTAGELETEGATATADVRLAATQTVRGTVFATDGVTPVPNTSVNVENFDHFGENWAPSFWVSTDSAGKYEVANVPVGTVRATARDPNDWRTVGFNEASVTTAEAATIDVTLGNAIRSFVELTGTDGFIYDVDCEGELDSGGTIDSTLSRAYRGAYFLRMFGEFYPCFDAARLEADNRQFVLGPAGFAGLKVVRKTFVPENGGFARYLEIVTNPTALPISTVVQVESFLGAGENSRVVVAPSATTDTFAITDDSSSATFRPTLAHVFAGPAAGVGVSSTKFVTGEETIFYRWNVTVPAGQTIILMHFAVQRGNGDTAAARAQAEAIVDLSDPNALAGMTVEEKARVVNFVIP